MKFDKLSHVLALAVTILLGGCGPIFTGVAALKDYNPEGDNIPTIGRDSFTRSAANDFALMAWFALISYRDDLSDDRFDAPCDYQDTEITHQMPSRSGSGQWSRWVPNDDQVEACHFNKSNGLFYETYIYKNSSGEVTKAVIAFRGTENSDGQFFKDWGTNLSAVFGLQPAQYKSVRKRLPPLIDGLINVNREMEIFAVGHSLGGGLAQQAGYLSKRIAEVYTFNTSPVTNWTRLKLAGDIDKRYPIVHRVFHTGEVLEVTRQISANFTGSRFGRSDMGLQFKKRTLFDGHSMNILACSFAQIVVEDPGVLEEAAHHYYKGYAEEKILTDDLCRKYALDRPTVR